MNGSLKAKATTQCATCCSPMRRSVTIKVEAVTIEAAKIEARAKIISWRSSLEGSNCRICASIIKQVGGRA